MRTLQCGFAERVHDRSEEGTMRSTKLWMVLVLSGLSTLWGCEESPDGYGDYARDGYGNNTSSGVGGDLCTKHSDCQSGVCKLPEIDFNDPNVPAGTCVPDELIQHVDSTKDWCKNGTMGNGSKQMPYCKIDHAKNFTNYIKLYPGTYDKVSNPLKPLLIVGPGRDVGNQAVITGVGVDSVVAGAHDTKTILWLDGVSLKTSPSGTAAVCTGGATLGVLRSLVYGNHIGILAKNCEKIRVEQSKISENAYALQIETSSSNKSADGSYRIVNNLFLNNTLNNLKITQGKQISTKNENVFALNTIVSDNNASVGEGWAISGEIDASIAAVAEILPVRYTVILGGKSTIPSKVISCSNGSNVARNCNLLGVVLDSKYGSDAGYKSYGFDSLIVAPTGVTFDTNFCVSRASQNEAILKYIEGSKVYQDAVIDYFGKSRGGNIDSGYCQIR